MGKSFSPSWGQTQAITNAIAASTAIVLPSTVDELFLTNTSATATVYVMVTEYDNEATPVAGTAPTTTTGLPVLPASQVRVHIGPGFHVLRAIASAADGVLLVTPGKGV
jgi:hypothetical protein